MVNNEFVYTTALHKIRQMKSRIKVIPGGSSAGKTYSILPILINMAIISPGISISVCALSMPHLKRGAMRDFLKIMKTTNRYIDKNWNRTDSIYKFTNGSYIEFFSVDDEEKLRGARRNVLYINEINNINEEAYTQLAMRTDKDIYLDYNPSNRFWIDNVLSTPGVEKLILTYKDNEALPQSVIDFLESKLILAKTSDYWKNWCNVYLYGLDGALEGTVFNNWSIIDNLPLEASLIGYGMDFGFTNDPSTCVGVYKYNNELILDEIIYHKGLSNSDLSKLMFDNEVKGEIYADSADPKSIDELRKYGHKIYPAKKGPDSILAGIQLMQEYKLNITKRSLNGINELTNYAWKKDNNNNSLNIPIDIFNHFIDATRYLAIMKLGKRAINAGKFNYGAQPFNEKHKF